MKNGDKRNNNPSLFPGWAYENIHRNRVRYGENNPEVKDRIQATTTKTPRNSPCSCGSGIKFKKCHGKPTVNPPPVYDPEEIMAALESIPINPEETAGVIVRLRTNRSPEEGELCYVGKDGIEPLPYSEDEPKP